MNEKLEIMTPESGAINPAPAGTTYMDIMARMSNNLKTPEDVAAFRSLVELHEHMEDKQAAAKALREFNQAFSKLQKEMPKVRADKVVMGKGAAVGDAPMYTYASYQEIMAQVQPHLNANGFSVRFSQELTEGRVTYTCYLIHEGGHSASTQYTVRSGRGAPGMNETKEDSAASSVCQRECLCDALNIVRVGRDDDDPRRIGSPIDKAKALALLMRVREVLPPPRELKMLTWIVPGIKVEGMPTFEDYMKIMSNDVQRLEDWLKVEESKSKK